MHSHVEQLQQNYEKDTIIWIKEQELMNKEKELIEKGEKSYLLKEALQKYVDKVNRLENLAGMSNLI